jgi:hypothetical protein
MAITANAVAVIPGLKHKARRTYGLLPTASFFALLASSSRVSTAILGDFNATPIMPFCSLVFKDRKPEPEASRLPSMVPVTKMLGPNCC